LENVEDLFSASVLMKYDPQLLSIEDVQHGDFLSGGTQEVAIVQRIDKEKGEARIFTTRQPNTAGVNGKGVLLSLVVRRLTSSPASMQLMEVGVRNSRQKSLPVRIAEATTEIQ
jgi:general secretion pathway protein D